MDEDESTIRAFIKRSFSSFTWVIFFFFIALTGIVYLSQNSVPGEPTFAVKLGFEEALVRASRVMNNEITVQIELTKRRVKETEKVIATNHASESLTNLANQVSTTEQTILAMNDPQKQKEAAKEYIETLSVTDSVLESEKIDLPKASIFVPPTSEHEIIPSPTQAPPTLTSYPTSPPQITSLITIQPIIPQTITTAAESIITSQIIQTQKHIANTIERLSKFEKEPEKERKETKQEDKKN